MTTENWVELKEEGNRLFKAGSFLAAAAKYTKSIKECNGESKDLAILHSNRCAALLKLNKVQKAIADAEACTTLNPGWEKGWFRKGQTLEAAERYEEALQAFEKAEELSPEAFALGNKKPNLQRLIRKKQKSQQQQKSAVGQPPQGRAAVPVS